MTDYTADLQLFPALPSATEAALRASIKRFGVLVPVVQDQHGRILDGHHRTRIAEELGITYRVDMVIVADDAEAAAIVETLNTDRGHRLKSDMLREVFADLLNETEADGVGKHSVAAVSEALGVTQPAGLQIERELISGYMLNPDITHRRGRDGKVRPARRPTVVPVKDPKSVKRTRAAVQSMDTLPTTPVVDPKRAERMAREQAAERRRNEPQPERAIVSGCDIRIGAFVETLADVKDVDAIITDPPYGVGVEAARDLLYLGARILRPGRLLVALVGQLDLPVYLSALRDADSWPAETEPLSFRWACAWLTPGAATRVYGAKFATNWKPILVFERGGEDERQAPRPWIFKDLFRSPADDKSHHHWGQSVEGFKALVETFTEEGDLVVDPYLGGGTTAVACKDTNRRFIGCDIDPAAVSVARERVA